MQLSEASMQVTLRLGRKCGGPDASVVLMRALTESDPTGLKVRTLVESTVLNASGTWRLTVCDAHRRLFAIPLLKFNPCGRESPWR